MPGILVFASGTPDGGGSGLRWLIHGSQTGLLQAEITGVVSNHEHGGVRRIADQFKRPFVHLPGRNPTAEEYRAIRDRFQPDLIAFSGWVVFVRGINGVNIHPGKVPETAGRHGDGVHKKALELYQQGVITCTAVTMHAILEEDNTDIDKTRYDTGPILFQMPVYIEPTDTAESLGARVNRVEHGWQTWVTNLIVQGVIGWRSNGSIYAPNWYCPFLTLPTPLVPTPAY